MSELKANSDLMISLNAGADLIGHTGQDVSYIFQGEPGIGKSAILKMLAERDASRHYIYMDGPLLDLGDVGGVPRIEMVNGVHVTKFAPNALMGFHFNKPVTLMVDEFGKMMRPVQNMFLRLLLEHKLNDLTLPEGSTVFGTTNMTTDGLGDNLLAHVRNRVSFVTVRKPTQSEWQVWAMDNGIAPEVGAFAKFFSQVFESYLSDDVEGNPYVFNPRKQQGAFVTPRSLEKASHIIKHRGELGAATTTAALAGAIGIAGARDLVTYAEMADKLPTWESLINNPKGALVPTGVDQAAAFMVVFNAVSRITKATMDPWLDYLMRLPKEMQGVFALEVVKTKNRDAAISNRKFVEFAAKNSYLF